MKPKIAFAGSDRGNTYLTVLWILLLSGTVLAAYLTLVGSQNESTMRSQAWNRALVVAEAGIEDGLAHLNKNGGTNGNLYTDGWWETEGKPHKVRLLDDAIYDVVIEYTKNPVIYCRGHVPLLQNFQRSASASGFGGPFLADLFYWWWSSSRYYVNRTVRVDTRNNGMFVKSLVAKQVIDLNGNNIRSDSFDSVDPRYSTNGMYDPSRFKDGGDVATTSGFINNSTTNITLGNANIFGRLATGYKGRVSWNENGVAGSISWHNLNATGIQPGWFTDDMNVKFDPVQPPFSSGGFVPGAGAVDGTNYALVLGDGTSTPYKYESASIVKMAAAEVIYINGNVTWWCKDGIDLGGQSQIVIAPGASLQLFVGTSATTGKGVDGNLNGNGVANLTGNAANFRYFGLPSNKSMSLGGNGTFVGAIYAPAANIAMNGGGSTVTDFIGAGIFNNIRMNGHYNFHYDENLGRIAPLRGYIITAWSEL